MVDYSKLCELYHDGFCVHVGNGYGIFEKCIFAKVDEKYKGEQMMQCPLRKCIVNILDKDVKRNYTDNCVEDKVEIIGDMIYDETSIRVEAEKIGFSVVKN
jgi:hypothetical protein